MPKTTINVHHHLEETFTSFEVCLFPLRQRGKLVPVHAKDLGKLHVTEVLLLLAGINMAGDVLADQDAVGQAAPTVRVAARDEAIGNSLWLGDLRNSSSLGINLLNVPLVLLPCTKVSTKIWRLISLKEECMGIFF